MVSLDFTGYKQGICWTAITGFAVSILARMSNAIHGDSLRIKLVSFLAVRRKHLGLLSLFFLTVHILMSLVLFSPAYYGKFFMDSKAS